MVWEARRSCWWIPLGVLSASGVAAGLYMNRHGVDVEIDSAAFVTAGIRLARGEGISEANQLGAPHPLTWFPPMMAWIVAILEWLHLHFRSAFALINAVIWGMLIAWTGWLARRITGGSILAGLLAASAILTSDAIALDCGMLYSEPPFLLWELGALVALACWWKHPAFRWIFLAGICAAGAFLTRYVGLVLLFSGCLIILARPGEKWIRRLLRALIFGGIAAGPVVAWHFWETAWRHGGSARAISWHPITHQIIADGLATLSAFVLPTDFATFPHAQAIILCGIFVLLGFALWQNLGKKREAIPPLVAICAAFMLIYGLFLIVSISIADADTPLDPRILSVIVPPGIILVAWLGWISFRQSRRLIQWSALAGIGTLLVLQGIATLRNEVQRSEITLPPGFTSETLDAIRALPSDVILYSDHPRLLYMAIRRKSEPLPLVPLQSGSEPARRENFQQEVAHIRQTLAAHGGYVVYWEKVWIGDTIIPEDRLRAALPVAKARYFDDGVLLQIAAGK